MKLALRGTRDHKSAFYQHALLEDIYDSNSIRVQFGHRFFTGGGGDFKDKWCRKLTPATGPGVELIKLSIDPRNPSNPTNDINQFRLNALEGAYNGRVLTILEGPLTGQSFRILKYVGYVPSSNDTVADPNITGGTPLGPKNTYSRQDATDYDYSIVIDLSTVRGKVEGRWRASSGLVENFSGEIGDWLALPNGLGLRNLFYFCDTSTGNYQGYKCLINGAAFNNAGISGRFGSFLDLSLAEWQQMIDANLTSVFLCMKYELGVMAAQGFGAIVNASSGAGIVGAPGLPHYTAAKHGVLGITKCAAQEFAAKGVRVNAILPGTTRTPMIEGFIDNDPAMEQALGRSVGRGYLGEPSEVAETAVWLCSDRASFVSGATLAVDGSTTNR